LRDDKAKFDAVKASIFGINPGSMSSHKKFTEKYSFNFPLLVDKDRIVAAQYGALKENGTSIERSVCIVDQEGKVTYAQKGMPSDEELLDALKT
jgi:peroxiredoxin Q/BCP